MHNLTPTSAPAVSTRAKSVEVVQAIAQHSNQPAYQVWGRIYDRLQLLYGVDLASHPRKGKEPLISVAERYGYIEQVYAIVLAEWLFAQTQDGQA